VIHCAPEVADALAAGRAVVGLESSVLAQGLPVPANREAAERVDAAVRGAGAVPAILAVVRGVVTAGLDAADLERFLARDGVRKVSARDLPAAMADGADGATTVAAAVAICARLGIRTFATGGIGGVHRDAPFDESADLGELARSPVTVVCAGVKSILDVPATLERFETLGIPVLGLGTTAFPGFFSADAGVPVPCPVADIDAVVRVLAAHDALGRPQGVVVAVPPPPASALDAGVVDTVVADALAAASAAGVRGAAVTPFLLAAVDRATGGRSVAANLALLAQNAAVAARIAVRRAGH
jgi:pseudouridine-5'-phosphate glycosidase